MVDLMLTSSVQHPDYESAHQRPQQPLPDNWLYEIRQKGKNTTPYYVMVQNVKVGLLLFLHHTPLNILFD